MPARIVDLFEPIKIDHDECHGFAALFGFGNQPIRRVRYRAPVEATG
jgi:hypothetical protein